MEPHLYLTRGKKKILLVRYYNKLHFVNLDHRLNYKVRRWFLERPRTDMEMDEKGLVRDSVPLTEIRGVAAGGTGWGMVVQFYLKDGKKRYELSKDCELSDMSALFDGLESFDPPKKDSNWHDPRLAKQDPNFRKVLWPIGWILNAAACVTGFLIWEVGFEIPWLCWLCLLLIPVSIAMYCRYPDYYAIINEKRKYGEKKGVRQLWTPVVCPACMVGGAISNYAMDGWWKAWIYGAAAVAVLTVVLYLSAPLFRAGDHMLAVVLLGLLLSGGPMLMLNNLLDNTPAREIRTEVVDKYKHTSRKSPDRYDVTVILEGKETDIPVTPGFYNETEIGETVTVEYHEGAFGIPFAQIAD